MMGFCMKPGGSDDKLWMESLPGGSEENTIIENNPHAPGVLSVGLCGSGAGCWEETGAGEVEVPLVL